MKVKVHMLAFMDGEIREVVIPDDEAVAMTDVHALLEGVFFWGQNDFQPVKDRCSVSVGDVAELDNGEFWRVAGTGWQKLGCDEFEAYKLLVPGARASASYGFTGNS